MSYLLTYVTDGDTEPLLDGEHPSLVRSEYVKPGQVYCRVFYADGLIAEYRGFLAAE